MEVLRSPSTSHWCTISTLERQHKFHYVIESKIVTPRVKQMDIPVCFLQEQFDICLSILKYGKSCVMPVDMCT